MEKEENNGEDNKNTNQVSQPHDKFFRSTFGQQLVAADFLENFLPSELVKAIDLKTLEPQKDSFIDKELKEEFADLLFKVDINKQQAYIYFLIEHKSYKDRLVIFQILKYMIKIWESKIQQDIDRRKKDGKTNSWEIELPIILPLIVYHDEGKWNIKKTLGEMMPYYINLPDDMKKYIPNFEYLLFDLSEINKDTINLLSETIIVIEVLSRVRHALVKEAREILKKAIRLMEEAEDKDQIVYYVSACIRYILSIRDDISEREMQEIAGKISTEGGELVMTVADKLRQEGIERGIELGKIDTVKQFLKEGADMELILRASKLPREKIEEIKKELSS